MVKSLHDTPDQELQREGIESFELSEKGDDSTLESIMIQLTYFTVTREGRGCYLDFYG